MNNYASSLILHRKLKGKISIASKVPIKTKEILSLLYTPGVAGISQYISLHPKSVNDLTIKKNTIAVVTDGSAVLGLGNVGPYAALPVMEGKCAIFKEFADIDAFPICLNTQNPEEIVNIIKNISPAFGAVNLEDISSPRCFEIEKNLQDLDIPVVHDDQHATSIAVLAALLNAVKVVGKNLKKSKLVIVGSGAAGHAISKLLIFYKLKNIIVVDKQGILSLKRKDLPPHKRELAKLTNPENLTGDLKTAIYGADALIGVSAKDLFTREIILGLNRSPIVFALANPDPEIKPETAKKFGVKVIATGRSDYPNQINNALVFPGMFKGLLKTGKYLTMEMKVKIASNIASLVKDPTSFRIIPSIFDRRLVGTIYNSFTL